MAFKEFRDELTSIGFDKAIEAIKVQIGVKPGLDEVLISVYSQVTEVAPEISDREHAEIAYETLLDLWLERTKQNGFKSNH